MAEHVAGKHLTAENDEVADRAARERDRHSGQQGVADELVREHALRGGQRAAGEADEVEPEGEHRDVEAERVGADVGERQPDPGDREREDNAQREAERDPRGQLRADAAGATSSAKTSSTPVICAVAATASPSTTRNPTSSKDRDAARGGSLLVDRGEKQRSPGEAKKTSTPIVTAARIRTSPVVIPRNEPKSSSCRFSRMPP